MSSKTRIYRKQVIDKLTAILDVQFIFLSNTENKTHLKDVWIIILKSHSSSLALELATIVTRIFQNTNSLYRIFSYDYAEQQLKDGNLFFVHGCSREKMAMRALGSENDIFYKYYPDKRILEDIKFNSEKERQKAAAFMDGAIYFIENNEYSMAAFMLHQHIELWFRNAGLVLLGKERKSHSIKELQANLKPFSPELGTVFDSEIETDKNLLKLLDEAYTGVRYLKNYYITRDQVNQIMEKAIEVSRLANTPYQDKIIACQKRHESSFWNFLDLGNWNFKRSHVVK